MAARSWALALAVAAALPTAPAHGQQKRFVPSLVVSECYDDNVFSTSAFPETDFITRIIPSAEASYRTPAFSALGRYSLEADIYREHPSVNTVPAGQDVVAELGYGPSRRLLLSARGGYTETRSASGLATVIGLDLGQVNAWRVAGGGSLLWRVSKRTRATFTGDWDRDRLVGAEWGSTRTAGATLAHRPSPRLELGLGYQLRRFDFETQPGLTSHVVSASVTRDLGRKSQLTLSGGPRFDDDGIDGEGAFWLQTRPGRADVTFGASRVGSRVLGFPGKWLPGAATTESVALELGFSPSARMRFALTPGYYHTRLDREARQVTVRRLLFEGALRLRRWLALLTSYEWSLQQGDLSAEPGDVRHRIFMVRFASFWEDRSGRRPPVIRKPGTATPEGEERDGVTVKGAPAEEEGVER